MKWVFKKQILQMFGLKLNKYDQFSPTWSCGSRQQDTTFSGWKINPFKFKPLSIVIFIHYKPRIAVAILDL